MDAFELAEMTKVLDMSPIKAKNWTSDRPFKIPASVHSASGTGSRNLYNIEDVYLMGLAYEFSKAGFAAMAIGRLVLEAIDAKRLAKMDWLTVYRAGGLKYIIKEGKAQPPESVLLWQTVNVGAMVKRINEAVEKKKGGKR